MAIQSDVLNKTNGICVNKRLKHQTNDEKLDINMSGFPCDTYVLIVPSNKTENYEENHIKCEKIMTMTSEQFFLTFRALLAVSEETNCDAQKSELEGCIAGIPDKEKRQAQSPGKLLETVVERKMVDASTQTYASCTITAPDKPLNKLIVYNGDIIPEESHEANSIQCSNCKAKMNSFSKTETTTKTNNHCTGNTSVTDYDLKAVLRNTKSHIRNLSLNEYRPQWAKSKNFKDMSLLKRLYCLLALLNEFCYTANGSPSVQMLIRRYLQFLVKLCAEVCLAPPRSEARVLEFSDLVLKHTRKTGTWEFKAAWCRAEADQNRLSKKVRSSRSISPITHLAKPSVSNCSVSNDYSRSTQDRNINKNEHLQVFTSNSKSSSPIDRNCYLRTTGGDEEHDEFSELSETCYKRHVELTLSKKEAPRFKRPGVHNDSLSIKRCKFSRDESRDARVKSLLNDGISDAISKNNRLSSKRFCKFFNSVDGCYKSTEQECGFSHTCSICFSTSHGRHECL